MSTEFFEEFAKELEKNLRDRLVEWKFPNPDNIEFCLDSDKPQRYIYLISCTVNQKRHKFLFVLIADGYCEVWTNRAFVGRYSSKHKFNIDDFTIDKMVDVMVEIIAQNLNFHVVNFIGQILNIKRDIENIESELIKMYPLSAVGESFNNRAEKCNTKRRLMNINMDKLYELYDIVRWLRLLFDKTG